ncbi:MAG: type I restriction-modification system subunit M N-terminal domain-containing protein, partial [Microcystaceae cyanobacterium]
MNQLEHIEVIEKSLWEAADNLRANSNYASNEYFLPVMGLLFLRHAYSRYLTAKAEIEPTLPARRGGNGEKMSPTKAHFKTKRALFLREESQFDYLVNLPKEGNSKVDAICRAMELIEEDYVPLRGILPKEEYKSLDNDVLASLLEQLNPQVLKNVS